MVNRFRVGGGDGVEIEACVDPLMDVIRFGEKAKKIAESNGYRVSLCDFKIEREVTRLRTLYPQGKYLYDHLDTEIECSECHEKFLHTELEADYEWMGDDEIWSNKICPKCGVWNCCEIEYEELNL
jgi:hypothetical protein